MKSIEHIKVKVNRRFKKNLITSQIEIIGNLRSVPIITRERLARLAYQCITCSITYSTLFLGYRARCNL